MEPVERPPHSILSGRRRTLAAFTLTFGNFMVILDLTIANVSVPHIAGELGITLDQGTWIITSYAVAEAICVPLTGWLSQRFGSVRLFIAGMIGFGLFSLLCGLSLSLGMLVACRIGQGLCGAPLLPLSQALTMRIYPPEQRTAALGTWSMTVMAGPALGPILGGLISDTVNWHWIFLINVPIAALLVASSLLVLRPVETPTATRPIDRVGIALLVFWITCLQIMLDIGRDRDWFGDPLIVALAIGAAIGFCVFVIWELTEEHPVVDLSIFRYPSFAMTVAPFGLCYGVIFSVVVIAPQWLQSTLGFPAFLAGTVTAFQAVAGMIVSAFVARMARLFNLRLLMAFGIFWLGVVSVFRALTWTTGSSYFDLALPMFLSGLGIPLIAVPLATLSLSAVPADKLSSAAGLQTFVRTVALAISTSLAMTWWGNFQRVSRNEIVSSLQPAEVQSTLASRGFDLDQIRMFVAATVEREANTVGMNQVFLFTAALAVVAAVVVLFGPHPSGPRSDRH